MGHILSESQYAAIGRVAAQAARLDAVLEGFLADALSHDTEVALVAVTGMPFDRKSHMLETILAVRIPGSEELQEAKPLLASARDLMKDRNEFLHGMWQFDADANLEVRTRERKTRKLKVRAASVDDLAETARRITFVANELEGLWMDLLRDIGAYRATEPGVWQQIRPHRPYATDDEKRRPTAFVIEMLDDPLTDPDADASSDG